MKTRGLFVLAASAGVVLVLAGRSHTNPFIEVEAPSDQLNELLNGIDYVPDDQALPVGVEDDLRALAADTQPSDPGLRIRALRALAHYPGTETETVLIGVIDAYTSFSFGIEILYLRSAMRALAEVNGGLAFTKLPPLLNNASRDVRAAAAQALAIAGDVQAIPLLRQRLDIEQVPQVRLAISEAIRSLTGA